MRLDRRTDCPPMNALTAYESPDALVLMTAQGEVVDWNHGAQAIFGYAIEEARGRLLNELVVPRDHAAEQDSGLQETLASGAGAFESVRRRKDGSLLYVDVSMRRLSDASGIFQVLSAEKDVTQIKVLRDARLMEARFRDLLESTPDGMANPTGHIVVANSQAERLFGYEDGSFVRQTRPWSNTSSCVPSNCARL